MSTRAMLNLGIVFTPEGPHIALAQNRHGLTFKAMRNCAFVVFAVV